MQVGFMLPFLTFAPIAGLLAARRPTNPIGWILLVIPASAVLYALGQQYAYYGLVTAPGSLPAASLVAWARLGLWVPTIVLFLVWLPLLYPTGRPLTRRWRAVGWLATAVRRSVIASVTRSISKCCATN